MRTLLCLRLLPIVFMAVFARPLCAAPPNPQGVAYFEKHIRPVLVEHCYECHSEKSETLEGELRLDVRAGLLRGGESGAPSVVPGQPGKSLLIKALKHEDSEMPPDEKLPDAVIARFEHWIKIGAPDPRNGDLKPLASYDFEKAREFWSLKKPVRHKLPQVRDASWPRDDLDHFVLASLEAKDLASLFGEHIGDSIEGDVMEVGIVDRDGVNRGAELSSQGECRDQAPETLMGSVQRHQDGAIPDSSVRGFDDQGIHLRTAHDALADRSDQAGLDCPETLGAQDEEVVVPALGFLQNHAIVAALVGEA